MRRKRRDPGQRYVGGGGALFEVEQRAGQGEVHGGWEMYTRHGVGTVRWFEIVVCFGSVKADEWLEGSAICNWESI